MFESVIVVPFVAGHKLPVGMLLAGAVLEGVALDEGCVTVAVLPFDN